MHSIHRWEEQQRSKSSPAPAPPASNRDYSSRMPPTGLATPVPQRGDVSFSGPPPQQTIYNAPPVQQAFPYHPSTTTPESMSSVTSADRPMSYDPRSPPYHQEQFRHDPPSNHYTPPAVAQYAAPPQLPPPPQTVPARQQQQFAPPPYPPDMQQPQYR